MAFVLVVGPIVGLADRAQAQDEEPIRFTRFDAAPDVLSREGGILTVSLAAETNASQIVVTLDLVAPDGSVQDRSEEHTLVSRSEDRVGGEIEVPIRQGSQPGEWQVRIDDVLVGPEDEQRTAQAEGSTSSSFQVYRLLPVAGLQSQAWPQFGGDPAHTGRTVAVGPPAIEVVRWRFTPPDDRPFHTPVVGDEGRIFAATWGGSLHALDSSGDEVWSEVTSVPGGITYPPVVGPEGHLLVPADDGILQAWTPDGQLDWTRQLQGEGEFRSGPTVGPDGRVYYIRAPWTLVAIDTTGDTVFQTALPEPTGGAPEEPTVPRSVPGPRVAVDDDGTALATAGDGLAVVPPNGTVTAEIDCSCPPRAVGLAPQDDVAFLVGDQEVVGVSLRSGAEIWSTDDQSVTTLEGDVWHPPAVGFDGNVYVVSEDGKIHSLTVDGQHLRTVERLGPLRGQPIVDANGDLYFADACRTLRSVDASLNIRWTKEIDAEACAGLSQSAVLTAGGAVVWPAPDGDLLMLGSNRPPVPAFDVYWDGDEFVFDASASEDPDGSDMTFAWAFGSATDDRGRIVRPNLPALGSVNVTLTVSDGLATVSKTREVTINYPPNPAFTNRTEGFDVLLNATTTVDPEGDPISYNWTVDGQTLSDNATLRLPSSGPRVYNVTLAVTDGNLEQTLTRTVLTPVRSLWSEHEIALVQGDCPSNVCTVPSSLILTEGSLAEVFLANGAGRTVHAQTSFSTVEGAPDRIKLEPREREAFHVRVNDTQGAPFQIRAVGSENPTTLPVTVRPAPAELTWTLLEAPQLQAGEPATLEFRISGPSPSDDVTVGLSLRSGGRILATDELRLPADETVNRTLSLTFIPSDPGPLNVEVVGETSNARHATLHAGDSDSAQPTFDVAEPDLLTTTLRTLAESPYVTAGTLVVAAASLAGVGFVLYQRRRETHPTTQRPDPSGSGSSEVSASDGATVAQGFMPRKVDRFHVERVLGEGGFGTTYLAEDSVLERPVVLKDLENVGEGDARDLLLHEAKTAANLQHGNVVVVHDVIEEEGRLLLVMEYVEGGTLADHVDGGLALKEALPLAQDLLSGLAALHDAGIVHRDLKPSNILMAPDGTAKITDFGVAVQLDEPPGNKDAFVGTPRYMAPEQLAGEAPGPASDVYAAGALVYHMLTGEHHLGLADNTPPPEELLERHVRLPIEDVPDELNDVLARALAEDPADRYPNAQAFLEALSSLDAGTRSRDPSTQAG